MKYEIKFVNKEFQELIDDKILNELLEMKEDEFVLKQFSYFFYPVKKDELFDVFHKEFKNREDIIIDQDMIIYKNQITAEVARLNYQDGKVLLMCDNKDNPLTFVLHKFYYILLHQI